MTGPDIVQIIKLMTYVRSPVFYTIKIQNPINEKVEFDASTTNPNLKLHGFPITVQPLGNVRSLLHFIIYYV